MYKYIGKLVFVTLTVLGVAAPAFALEVKLLCSIKLVSTYSNGQVERENFIDVIDVFDETFFLSIIPQSDKLGSVSSREHFGRSVDNYSDSNKWNLQTTDRLAKGQIVKTSITIDRNTGVLFYSRDWDSSKIVGSATGSCEKVDATKRKF